MSAAADVQPWQRPPFAAGNTAALKHGAYSERLFGPVRDELVAGAFETAPWLHAPEYQPAVRAWARAEASVLLVEKWLEENGGDIDHKGKTRPAADHLVRLRKQAADARARLGLDPLSRARLGRDVASSRADLAKAWALEAAQDAETPDSTTESDCGQEAPRERP